MTREWTIVRPLPPHTHKHTHSTSTHAYTLTPSQSHAYFSPDSNMYTHLSSLNGLILSAPTRTHHQQFFLSHSNTTRQFWWKQPATIVESTWRQTTKTLVPLGSPEPQIHSGAPCRTDDLISALPFCVGKTEFCPLNFVDGPSASSWGHD